MKHSLLFSVPVVCFILFCSSPEEDCTEASGTSACDELEASCTDDFNRVVVNSSLGAEQCSCCK